MILGLRMAAILGLLGFIVLLSPVWYMLWYLPMRGTNRWRAGRGLSTNIQGGIIVSAICFPAAYFVAPRFFPGDEWHGFNAFFQGSLISLLALNAFLATKFVDTSGVKYFNYLMVASLLAGLGLLYSGICWLVGREMPIGSEIVFFAMSMLVLAGAEVAFLKRNGWVFVPSHPK